ncbi:Vi polysaccharide biosynthesis UDP-N-acetylglucosamine C-6 dehydrogenase TviB [Nocardioides dongxiaopingii]|uniref:Vi polysaccharide biosynthesis UDP-N-acetylglucosamine C-6 dehydrogenase TviB n=1 Tax=Nocardioides sp. S-1144 TaxID=2582905 RepID=UPI00116283E2|nr:Vi polysaccharide biosynthesis UDP-N-acetylglucosamine C-6 dehydrogenase TviB [Nocardioides sp. S-1144]QDH10967.1 Vi polysaccharide biosynthesis UDP-N-acetylglucosamine C-6 dehydrogenase TviB [Nocardioides sp. S-1144]
MKLQSEDIHIGVVGLGYVGLPLAVCFSKQFDVVGFDINPTRVQELRNGHDRTLEVADDELTQAASFHPTTAVEDLQGVNVYIVTTPTPIDEHKQPDLRPVLSATRTVAGVLSVGDVVIYESTVYPGATEEECVPLLEQLSGLTFNKDFYVGYSPERINPGDRVHRLETIVKVTSGSTPAAAEFVDDLYRTVVTAGTHLAPSIRVAEAAKVIENTQRDVNIALVNELALVFGRLGIDTLDVLEAAGTKWNFLPFRPGLVGGHCIGVDPYYLTHKAQAVGYHPELILAGRRLNDAMGSFVASQLIKKMTQKAIPLSGARVLVLGLTFKENTPDLRNTRVVDIVDELKQYGIDVDVFDPWVDKAEARREYGIDPVDLPEQGAYAGIVVAVAHRQFAALSAEEVRAWGLQSDSVIYDLKSLLPRDASDLRL